MAQSSTLYQIADSILERQGTTTQILLLDSIDAGLTHQEIAVLLNSRAGVPVSARTVRRWAGLLKAGRTP